MGLHVRGERYLLSGKHRTAVVLTALKCYNLLENSRINQRLQLLVSTSLSAFCEAGRRGERMIVKKTALSLSRLSFAQKLELMETLWAELTRNQKKLESPSWHEAVLEDREEAFASGKVEISNWEEAKKRIKKKVS